MESASVVLWRVVKALNGIAPAAVDELLVLEVVAVGVRIFAGGVRVLAEGV